MSHGHKKDPLDLTFDPQERVGLTSAQAEEAYMKYGYNELPEVTISLIYVFFLQFTGTMPYILELASIVAIAAEDYADFGIIVALLCSNAILGFQEQLKAAESLRELTQKLEQKIAVLRDGQAEFLLTRLLVPGDVVLLIGGCQVPADIEWLEGDVLSVDTAALTGEPLPRKYPSEDHGKLILAGTTIRAGEAYGVVRKTGVNTEVGSASADVLKDKTVMKVSVFEERILKVVKLIIFGALVDVLIIFIIQGVVHDQFSPGGIRTDLLTSLSIIVAAIPIALPIVINVTMSLGAGKMAREFNAVVTSLPALQDISSMTVLCSDKTGTLTTAKITIHAESVWCSPSGDFSKLDVALYAGLASNRDKKEDAIDRSVIQHFDRVFAERAADLTKDYTKVRNVGFNPIYKRVLYEYSHPTLGNITIAKGLPTKVLDTSDGGVDDAADQWKCDNFEKLKDIVKKVDLDFSKAGYKTLGVAIKINKNPWVFVGILPMLDPPRHDTAQTVRNLRNAGIEVKMITGDHLNIAKETARLIGLNVNIYPGEDIRENTQEKNEIIKAAAGFAQVLPKDKREVVLVLRNVFQQVVGMTGDGVNDAPALSAAQCGVAVDDATDAAKNAAAIILTSPGLSAIYSGVIESRRIFRKLKSYVTYRFAASIQIVVVLTLLIYISNCPITALFIILLALFNDLTLLPIAYDYQNASSLPENPDVANILAVSASLGVLETGFTLLFAYANGKTLLFSDDFTVKSGCDTATQAAVWLQMFVATELLIFSVRAPSYIFYSLAPSPALAASVITGCIIASLIARYSSDFGSLTAVDILLIWAYDLICLGIVDITKVSIFKFYNLNTEVLKDAEDVTVAGPGSVSERPVTSPMVTEPGHALPSHEANVHNEDFTRESISISKLADLTSKNDTRTSQSMSRESRVRDSLSLKLRPSGNKYIADNSPENDGERISIAHRLTSSSTDLRPSTLGHSLRPKTPTNALHHK